MQLGLAILHVLLALALAVSGPALAIDTGGGSTDTTTAAPAAAPSLATARADIAASNWTKAISDLKAFLKGNSKSADGWNLLGFSYRNHGDLKLADTLRLDRSPNPQIAFGVGPHVCMGINLARLEIRVLFEELVRRFPDMHVAPGFEPVYVEHALVHALDALPVVYTPEPA